MSRALPLLLVLVTGCWITGTEQDERLGWWYEISVGYRTTCGLLASGKAECWGDVERDPQGTFDQVSAGYLHACGIDDGRVRCWGGAGNAIIEDVPAGQFQQVNTLATDACARDDAGRIACWGETTSLADDIPDGEYTKVVVGEYFACALGNNQDLRCWGQDDFGETAAPAGVFDDVDVSADIACGLSADDSAIMCWGMAEFDDLLRGDWEDLAVGWDFACGLDWEGDVHCYDTHDDDSRSRVGEAVFVRIDAGYDYVCGTTDDGRALCWGGDDDVGQTQVPHNPVAD